MLSLPVPYVFPYIAAVLSCSAKKCSKVLPYMFGTICFVFLTGFYMIGLNIYAYMNIHDVSWGNREAVTRQRNRNQKRREHENANYRSNVF